MPSESKCLTGGSPFVILVLQWIYNVSGNLPHELIWFARVQQSCEPAHVALWLLPALSLHLLKPAAS